MSVEKSGKFLGFTGSEKVYVRLYSNPTCPDTDGDDIVDSEDERPLYPFRFQYLGSDEHLNYVQDQIDLKMQDAYLYGDTITTMIGMWGIEILMDDYYDFLSYKGIDPTGKYREDYWNSDWDKYWDAYCDEINGYVSLRGSVSKELHYFRNNLNVLYDWDTLQNLVKSGEWTQMDSKESALHQHKQDPEGKENSKWISNNGHYELVFNGNSVLQNERNNPEDMGTYNFMNPIEIVKHLEYDVLPWINFGNSIYDTTTFDERFDDAAAGFIGLFGKD